MKVSSFATGLQQGTAHLLPGDVVNCHHGITTLQVVGCHLQAFHLAAYIPQLQYSSNTADGRDKTAAAPWGKPLLQRCRDSKGRTLCIPAGWP